jgi:hypothetical protein
MHCLMKIVSAQGGERHHHDTSRGEQDLPTPPFGLIVGMFMLLCCVGHCCNSPFGVVLLPTIVFNVQVARMWWGTH